MAAGKPNEGEREFEIGMDESHKHAIQRTVHNGVSSDKAIDNIMLQVLQTGVVHLQNVVESLDIVTKQAIRHADVAIDATWDPGPGEESLKKEEGE